MAYQTVKSYHEPIEANIALAKLQQSGIEAFLSKEGNSDAFTGAIFTQVMIEVKVNEEDVEKAKTVLT